MNTILLPPSDIELDQAIKYYEIKTEGLGQDFYSDFLHTIELIESFPLAWTKVGSHTHKIHLKRFPYMLLYIINGNNLLISCIAHQHRNPEYYVNRII